MNINDQKELLEGILNLSKHTKNKENSIDLPYIVSEINKKIGNSDVLDSENNFFLGEDGSFDIDALSKYSQSMGLDPIDLVEFAFNELQNLKSFSHNGQKIDLSKSNKIFQDAKRQFEEYKKSEDINNF